MKGAVKDHSVHHKHKGKSVGKISPDGKTFVTHRVEALHYVRNHAGYGMQRNVLQELVAKGVERIKLIELRDEPHGNGRSVTVYVVTPEWWLAVGTADVLRTEDGMQVFVTRSQLVAGRDAKKFTPPPHAPPASQSIEAANILGDDP